MTDFPFRLSFTRVPGAAWVFPMADRPPDRETWPRLMKTLASACRDLAIKPTTVRRLMPFGAAERFPAEGGAGSRQVSTIRQVTSP